MGELLNQTSPNIQLSIVYVAVCPISPISITTSVARYINPAYATSRLARTSYTTPTSDTLPYRLDFIAWCVWMMGSPHWARSDTWRSSCYLPHPSRRRSSQRPTHRHMTIETSDATTTRTLRRRIHNMYRLGRSVHDLATSHLDSCSTIESCMAEGRSGQRVLHVPHTPPSRDIPAHIT